jgi:hypothetical protein
MSMLKPQLEQEPPEFAAVQRLWAQPVFKAEEWSSPALNELLTELRATHVNGGAFFARFSFCDDPVIRFFISRNNFQGIGFFERFLTSSALRETLPALKPPASLDSTEWDWWSPYLLGGDWARILMAGGAYKKYQKGGSSAKHLGERVCADLFGDRFEEVEVFRSTEPWSDWFFDVAWDLTWIGVDKRHLKIWMLCLTDTD